MVEGHESFTRRVFARRVGGAVLGAPFVSLLDGIKLARPAVAQSPPLEQHIVPGVRISTDNGVEIVVPPLYHELVTARLTAAAGQALPAARDELRLALQHIEKGHVAGPSGLLVTVAWGMPYFRRHLPRLRDGRRFPDYLPIDHGASRRLGRRVPALVDAVRFPSDPETTVLESNDLVVLLKSDVRSNVTTARERLLARLEGVLEPTSIRSGFVGAGLPKRFATAAGIPGAAAIPDDAQLFLGFTSTQRSALGPTRIANFESLRGVTDQWPRGYFRHGTVMHLSHLFEDLDAWYSQRDFLFRVWATFRPGLTPPDGTRTLPEDASVVQTEQDVNDGFANMGIIGHSASLQPQSRLASADGRQLRRALRGGDGARAAGRFQHAREPVRLDGRQTRGPVAGRACGWAAFRLLHGDREHLRAGPPRDGRPLPGRQGHGPRPARRRAGVQQHPPHDAPPELPRAAAGSPLLSAR